MAITAETIDHNTLVHLVEAGAVRGVDVVGQPGGWCVVIKYGMTERALAVRRRNVRIFRKFESLAACLKEVGISRYQVDAANYAPATPATGGRPDTAERMRRAHEASAYDAWFRDQVQVALDDTAPSIPHEQVQAEWAAERAELLQRVGVEAKR